MALRAFARRGAENWRQSTALGIEGDAPGSSKVHSVLSEEESPPQPVVHPNFVMVPQFREAALEATYQQHVRDSQLAIDGTWLLIAAVVDVMLFLKLGMEWPLGLFAIASWALVYLQVACPAVYVKYRTLLLVLYKGGRAALHLMPKLVLWFRVGSPNAWLGVRVLAAAWNLVFGSKASLLMFQSAGGHVNFVVDTVMALVMLATSLYMTPNNCAACVAQGDVHTWMQGFNRTMSWTMRLATGTPVRVPHRTKPSTLDQDCFLLMAFCEVALGLALPQCIQYYQAATGRARYAITHKLRPVEKLRAEARLQSYSLACWLTMAWVCVSLLAWRCLETFAYAE